MELSARGMSKMDAGLYEVVDIMYQERRNRSSFRNGQL